MTKRGSRRGFQSFTAVFVLTLSLAQMIGTSRETVARLLSDSSARARPGLSTILILRPKAIRAIGEGERC
ncbi:MAG: hypothetical protein JWO97_1504 [Acidobacteria bacterium]|nr:hypothetical protein [Acidobacteriota bacterium]